MRAAIAIGLLALSCPRVPARAGDPEPPLVEKYLTAGTLAEGEAALLRRLKAEPKDDRARFGLGVLLCLRAVERVVQSTHRFGLWNVAARQLPPGERPLIPPNPRPDRITRERCRAILQGFVDDLGRVEATLADVSDPDVKLPLHFGRIRLDLDGDGRAGDDETFWRLYAGLNPRAKGISREAADRFVIAFDRGDVHWLRGYCHLLMALGEFALAHDGKELFERTAHLAFPDVESPYPFLRRGLRVYALDEEHDIADLIAFVHLIRLPVAHPGRTVVALKHLEAMIAQSRESWKSILAETDDDREWIPSPRQEGVIPNVRVDEAKVKGWLAFLDEAEDLLAGRKLVPFWRGEEKRGVNLRRAFTEPREFDLILWIQGTAAAPYLEAGPLTTPDVWRRLRRVFGGEFIGFALWFN